MSLLLDRPVSIQRGWDYLKLYELKIKVPRPEHKDSDPIEQENWKKSAPPAPSSERNDGARN